MAETTTAAPPPGVMQGGWLTRIRVSDPSSPTGTSFRWYQMYEFPAGSDQWVAYQYDDVDQLWATFGKNNLPFYRTWSESDFNKVVIAESNAEEVVGRSGSWTTLTNEIMQEAAAAAGVRDPGLVGRMASDPEMQEIMAQAFIGDWTAAQIKAAQRNTTFWKNVLYPGIENLYNLTSEPEKAYADYVAQVSPALSTLGYTPDVNGTFGSQISRMLDSKIDANVFVSQVPTFVRATQNSEFAATLNAWAERDLGRQIDFNDWFDLMAGETQPELEQVAERAQLEWVSQNQGSQLSQAQIEDLAGRTQLSEDEARRVFSDFNQGILALGDDGLSKYGLNRDEVLSVAAGVAPASGRSIDEVRLLVAKTARENALFDDDKINFYVGFNPQGQPVRSGLQSLAPESA